jgi:hypothetical protein
MLSQLQQEVGFTQLDMMYQLGGLSFEVAQESMELFAREVMPLLKGRVAEQAPATA